MDEWSGGGPATVSAACPRRVAIALAATVLSASAWPVHAQRFQVDTYTVTDGLPSSNVLGLTQDSVGRMWFATRAGIASYDGVSWTEHGDIPQPNQSFSITAWDERPRLWVASRRGPLHVRRFESDVWTTVPSPPAAMADSGIVTMDAMRHDGRPRVVVGTQAGDILLWGGQSWSRVAAKLGDTIERVAVTGDDVLVLADGRLYRSARGGPTVHVELPHGARAVRLAIDKTTRTPFLIGADWIARVDRGDVTSFATDLTLPNIEQFTNTVAVDSHGALFIGYFDRVVRVHPEQGVEFLSTGNGLAADGATDMLCDREGNVWIATPRGVSKLVSLRFASYRAEHGLFDDEVTAIVADGDSRIVLGHVGAVSFVEGRAIRTQVLTERNVRARILDLERDARGHIWAAMESVGLAEISPDRGVRWHFTDSLPTRSVRLAHDGMLWVATGQGIFRGGPAGFERYELLGDAAKDIRRILRIGEVLYFASMRGLYRLENGAIEYFSNPDDVRANSVYAVARGDDGTVWVGTGGGLMRADAGRIVRAAAPGPHTDRPVYFLTWDEDRRLWIGTDDGVLRWNGERSVHFSAGNGLIGRETNRAAGIVDAKGHVWIGTDRGVSVYRPEFEQPSRALPIVALVAAHVGDASYPLDAPMRLPHSSTVVFGYRAISLTDEHSVRVQARLAGFEEDWLEYVPGPEAIRYTSLPSGHYRLHLRASNAEGNWSDTVTSAPIVVLRPFWQRPLFFVLLGLGVAAIGYAMHHYLSQRQYARRLENEVRQKVKAVRRSEDQLRHVQATEKRRLEVTLEGIADGVIAIDRAGRVLLINPAAERMTGCSATLAIDRHVDTVLPLHDSAGPVRVVDALGEALSDGGTAQLEDLTLLPPGGEPRLIELSAAATHERDSESPTGVVLAFRDITERRQAETELARTQRLESLGLLAGGIAHDFNNLLTVVLGNLSLIRADPVVAGDHVQHIDASEVAIQRARELTQQLLTFAHGGAPMRKAASMTDVLRDAATLAMSGTNSRYTFDAQPDLWAARIDIGQINQVIHNLLINAVQAMPEGGTVRLAARNCRDVPTPLKGDRYVVIEVGDEGHGIRPEHLNRVFDPYFSTKETGRGLGLAAAYSIVRRHDGLIEIDSGPEKGTSFRVYLPATRVAAPPTAAPARPALDSEHHAHVLVMDDDRAVCEVVGELLKSTGCTVEFAADGAQAVELYVERSSSPRPFDVVLMDLTVPGGIGGKEAMQRLLEFDPGACGIVASGYSNDPVMARYAEYGFRACVRKPFGAEELSRVLLQVLHRPRQYG